MNDLDRELEQALHQALDPIAARPVPARRPSRMRSRWGTVMGGAGAALSIKVLAAAAVAAATVTVAGVATTGSLSPAAWGHEASNTVSTLSNSRGSVASPQQAGHATGSGNKAGTGATSNGSGSSGGQGAADGSTTVPPAESDTAPGGQEPKDPAAPLPPVKVTPRP